ncbi:MAG: hypothetical protein R6T99_00585 [Bacteroidales bacterium]
MNTLIRNQIYSRRQLEELGLEKSKLPRIDMDVYKKGDKVYFFEMLEQDAYRLFTIISQQSFYLK